MAPESYTPNPLYFDRAPNQEGKRYFICKVCSAQNPRRADNCKVHETTQQHLSAVDAFLRRPPPPLDPGPTLSITDHTLKEDALRALLVSASSDPHQPRYPHGHPLSDSEPSNLPASSARSPSPLFDWGLYDLEQPFQDGKRLSGARLPSPFGIDWGLYELEQAFQDGETLTPQEQYRQQLCQKTLDLLNGNISDYDAGMNADDSSSDESFDQSSHMGNTNDLPRKRARAGDTDPKRADKWYPWPDHITWSLDILMHLPRSVFSQKQLDLFLWLLRINNIDQVPSSKSLKTLNNVLQNMCGVETLKFEGKFGHPYHVNSLSQILAQEMCNPKVRPHLHFYPEDTGEYVSEIRQASNWLNEVSPDEATPMIRILQEDYYIYEPAMLTNGSFCIPFRWYTKGGKNWARAWGIEPKFDKDSTPGWIVRKDIIINVLEDMFLKNFPRLSEDHKLYGVPHPSDILGIRSDDPAHPQPLEWTHTVPADGNRWRKLSKGHRTLFLPLMTYCDDTSGNQSKKWNEHNSFLFTLAGLPRDEASKEYNVHFLCTSNLAPPLEMLDGVVSQIEDAKKEGIWAWDCVFKEPVLIVPTVPSMLGDNPMQSEFCCHIGAQGKYFCRMCMVKGTDAEESKTQPVGPTETRDNSPAPSIATCEEDQSAGEESERAPSNEGTPPTSTKRKPREMRETMQAMFRRISDFIQLGIPRKKETTRETLASFFSEAKTLFSKSRVAKARTETGVKDTFQQFFLDRLFSSYKHKYGPERQKALDAAIRALPDDITSPIWRLGLDPHQDTPVEILHVVLLGFVKYFWRDLVQNQVNDEQKQTLIARLNSFDVKGLGISQLGGATLVNYAGSLTGRDFRAISQVAPFVIYDLVPPDVYDAWVALSTLVPLIWQPVIQNITDFCATLETEIQNFLIKTVKWTCGWFNKSKFHILLHLPNHIRRFGPAILFATEAFESFNAVIRAKSVHSNRQAPSRDIALAFAQGNRVRHLMSGGYILLEDHVKRWQKNPETVAESAWRPVGKMPIHLMASDATPAHYLGLSTTVHKLPGGCKSDKKPARSWRETLTGKHLPHLLPTTTATVCMTSSEVTLPNEDQCSVGQYVIVRHSPPFIACVQEILQIIGRPAHKDGLPEGLLLQTASHTPGSGPLPMPRLQLEPTWSFVKLEDVLCTVNVQHDCRRYECQTTGLRYVVQERSRSEQTVPVVEHQTRPDDLILNMAQMRDAVHLQCFRQTSPRLDDSAVSRLIHESVSRAIDSRKAAEATKSNRGEGGSTSTRGRGTRGRGRGSNRGRGRGAAPLSPGERVIDFT